MNANLVLNDDSDDSSAVSSNDNCSCDSLDVEPHRIDFDLSDRVRQQGGVMPGAGHNDRQRLNEDVISCGTASLNDFIDELDNKSSSGNNKRDDQQSNPEQISSHKSQPDEDTPPSPVWMSRYRFRQFISPWASLIDVYGDGNCLYYTVIIAMFCIRNDAVLPPDGWIDSLTNNLRDVTSLRMLLRNQLVDNLRSFTSHDPNIRRVHNQNGDIYLPFTVNNVVGPSSISSQLYVDGADYSRGCSTNEWGDIFCHIPIISYTLSTSVVCYKVGHWVDSRNNVLKNIITVVSEFRDGHVYVREHYGTNWSRPLNIQGPTISLCYFRNHFLYLHPHDCTVTLPIHIGTTFKQTTNPQPHQQQHEQQHQWKEDDEDEHRSFSTTDESHHNHIRPLTTEESRIVQEALYGKGEPSEIIASFGSNSVKRESIETCRPGVWLIDEVITYFLKLLSDQDSKICGDNPTRKRSHFFNSFFWQNLFDEKNDDETLRGTYNYEKVRRWSRNVPGGDIFELKHIFLPINHDNFHWTSACIFMEQKVIEYFDSYGCDGQHYLKGLLRYLADEWLSKRGTNLDTSKWQLLDRSDDIPQQKNGECLHLHFLRHYRETISLY